MLGPPELGPPEEIEHVTRNPKSKALGPPDLGPPDEFDQIFRLAKSKSDLPLPPLDDTGSGGSLPKIFGATGKSNSMPRKGPLPGLLQRQLSGAACAGDPDAWADEDSNTGKNSEVTARQRVNVLMIGTGNVEIDLLSTILCYLKCRRIYNWLCTQ